MDIRFRLKESNSRLIKLENSLDTERDVLINHDANKSDFIDNATHFNYMSSIEKYSVVADEYSQELVQFKKLLQECVQQQKLVMNNQVINKEVRSNYLPTSVSLSSPVVDNVYTNDDGNVSTKSLSREIATQNITNENNYNNIEPQQKEPVVVDEQVLQLPKPQEFKNDNNWDDDNKQEIEETEKRINGYQKKKIVKAKVYNKLSYKYEGRGFDIWKKNNRRPIYQITELFVWKTFGQDQSGLAKLKRFLVKRGGFKASCIESVNVETNRNGYKYGLIKVRESQENINNAINKMNKNKDEEVIQINKPRQYRSDRKENCKLFVKNFDILTGKDHKLMTNLFLGFGDLETDIFMNKDKNGNPYCFVNFRNIEDAMACLENQIWSRHDQLWFNGKQLNIQYADDSKNSVNNNNNNNKRRNTKGRRRRYN